MKTEVLLLWCIVGLGLVLSSPVASPSQGHDKVAGRVSFPLKLVLELPEVIDINGTKWELGLRMPTEGMSLSLRK